MALNIKNREVETLASELAAITGETKTEAIRKALAARKRRLAFQVAGRRRGDSFLRYLADEVWPGIPPSLVGRRPSRDEEDEILGYGPEGV
ncbi:MAG: type II toxin-antitoxin system VapB family antitoxin [bacterium]|nr:type II toxin-antitoxin system VapB family antitoxin [bacterium]